MARKKSAAILAFRKGDPIDVLLVHPGGPFWANKDEGAWSLPKGEFEGEEPLAAAKREFLEEVGVPISGDFLQLQPQRLKSGKAIYAWAVLADVDISQFRSNTFEMEWPPRSGRKAVFPEVDKAEWFNTVEAAIKINPGQLGFILELLEALQQPSQ